MTIAVDMGLKATNKQDQPHMPSGTRLTLSMLITALVEDQKIAMITFLQWGKIRFAILCESSASRQLT